MRRWLWAGCLGWCSTLATSASAAVIFSNVDPLNTNLALLSDQTLAGGHESNTVDIKSIYAWGLIVPVVNNSTLRTAVAPFNVGPSTGLRLDVFELPSYPPPRLGRTPTLITTGFVHVGSSAVMESLSGGRQWITFSFANLPLLAGKHYLFRASPDQTNGVFVAQQHYWLTHGNFGHGDMIQDIRYLLINSAVPEHTFGDTTAQPSFHGGLQLTDVSSAPEPVSLLAMALGSSVLLLRRRGVAKA